MDPKPRIVFRHEKVAAAIGWLQQRETATTEADYELWTRYLNEALANIKMPGPKTFEARARAKHEANNPAWGRCIERLLLDLDANEFAYPAFFEEINGVEVLVVRTNHVMKHLRDTGFISSCAANMPIRSGNKLRRELVASGVLLLDEHGQVRDFERMTAPRQRLGHMFALSLPELQKYGLDRYLGYSLPPEEDATDSFVSD